MLLFGGRDWRSNKRKLLGPQMNNPFSKMPAGASGDGTGGYGVTQTNGKGESVPQIDPTQALAYYAQAGQTEAAGIAAGNTAYQAALQTAATQMTQGYNEANATLSPLSTASNQALTLFQQMLGITPAAPTANFGSNLTSIDPSLSATAQLINQANSATDPNQRAALNTQIQQQITQAATSGVTTAQSAINALGSEPTLQNPGAGLTYVPATGKASIGGQTQGPGGNYDIPTSELQQLGLSTNMTPLEAYLVPWGDSTGSNQLAQQQATWTTSNTADQTALTNAQQMQSQLNQFNTQWGNTYNTAAPPQAFTGQQVTNQLESTPGYQFGLNQGDQQILRNHAAVGNLGTGNTQIALQNYGEQFATNTYGNYMNSLGQLINTGVPATQQIAANQANQGGYLSNLTQLGGQANDAASTAEAQAIGAAQTQQGNTSYNAAALNTQLQFDAYAANQSQAGQSQANAMNLAGSTQQSANMNASGAGFYQGMQAQVNQAAGTAAATLPVGGVSDYVSSNGGQSNGML